MDAVKHEAHHDAPVEQAVVLPRALTLWQPWATLLASGVKRIETRGWKGDYRGTLLIHAGKGWNRECKVAVSQNWTIANALKDLGYAQRGPIGLEMIRPLPMSAIVGQVTLVDMISTEELLERGMVDDREMELGGYGPDRFGWVCRDAILYPRPVPASGKQGLWIPSDEVVKRCEEAARDARAAVAQRQSQSRTEANDVGALKTGG